ncbi:3'-5' exonuclease [Phycicoccus flavus]|uniref:3'-5' exonuclease n=1 Tax=Phycicoccus flavus TaxID=2502783 RepID=UPI000FEBAFA6|nr:3'-5' exonuclease [Phycicoccus flavus]NHA68766.1 AAA family ATPase [Phycicoccus flavus]
MKVLRQIRPTPEQLTVINRQAKGVLVVRGAAGSGKTTTALYRLKQTVRYWQRRVRDGHMLGPVRVLVLTYNRTLRGYIEELARADITGTDVQLTIATFGKWATSSLPAHTLVRDNAKAVKLRELGKGLGLEEAFLRSEVDYVLGRFRTTELESYLTCERAGRGATPRVAQATRRRLLDEVIYPYAQWKADKGTHDWPDLANEMVDQTPAGKYHVVVVDEAQDFSANQVRAVLAHLAADHSVTFVTDGAQRIYPQRFTWTEVGLTVGPSNSKQLSQNFRNTRQIAAFAASLLTQVEVTDDSAIPDLTTCTANGPRPVLVAGRFSAQMDHVIAFIKQLDPDAQESVAILHAKGWDWFDYVKRRLVSAGLAYVEITRQSEWPSGPEQIALSTMHSVKGLEFDHVIIVGLNEETMPHGAEAGDSERDAHLRLLAMAAGRARSTLRVTYKPDEASDLIACIDPATYDQVTQ